MSQVTRTRERVPTGRRGRPSKSMIAAALERPFCAYLHKICLNNRLEGHRFCIDHIMNDKTAPYRLCTFVHPVTGKRCSRAAHKVDRRASPLCHYHKSLKFSSQSGPYPAAEDESNDPKALLEDLGHHVGNPDSSSQSRSQSGHLTRRPSNNTFWNSKPDGTAVPSAKLCKILSRFTAQRQNEFNPQIELPTIEEIAARHNNADSDTESVDNQDHFRHASVFTEEELTRTLRDKMIKLRRLYIEQYGHIQYILKEKRLKYIQTQRIEDDVYGDSYSFRNFREGPDYEKLSAMLRYQKTFGPESLLQEQAKRKKMLRPPTVGPHPHPSSHQDQSSTATKDDENKDEQQQTPKPPRPAIMAPQENICLFSKTQYGCDKPCIPLSPYCRQHILYDTKQVLFRPCAGGMPPCLTPVVSFTKKNKCWLHTAIN